jgi:hypothetical protein
MRLYRIKTLSAGSVAAGEDGSNDKPKEALLFEVK